METKQKIAIAGTGLVVAGIGLGVVGAAMIAPAVFSWALKTAEKGADRLITEFGRASRTVGTVAGTLQRSFNEATNAGITEIKRSRSSETKAAS